MRKTDALTHYGSTTKVAKALGISQAAVSKWGDIIPELQARRLAEITNGELKFDPALYDHQQPLQQAS